MSPIRRSHHPLVADRISRLRDRATDAPTFRRVMDEVSILLAVECTDDTTLEERAIETPVAPAKGMFASDRVVLAPILRAGLGMVQGMLRILPDAEIAHLGLYRDDRTLEPVVYYSNTPQSLERSLVIVLDPMLATGGSADAALSLLKRRGASRLKLCALIAAPEGLELLLRRHPDVEMHVAAIDEKLNERGYIVPGLGDAGDRLCGTL